MVNFVLRVCVAVRGRRFALLLSLLTMLIYPAATGLVVPVQAEGSRNLYPQRPNGDDVERFRANIEWRTSFYGTFLRRRSLFQVFAQTGEVILLGSSAVGMQVSDDGQEGDIRLFRPGRVTGPVGDEAMPETPDFSCVEQRAETNNPNQGRITSRAQELAGPDTIIDPVNGTPGNNVTNGYIPCFYEVEETGIHYLVFFGPEGGNSDKDVSPLGEYDLESEGNFNAAQGASVAAWDATVRSALSATEDINGRLFADYFTPFTGGWPRPLYSSYYVLTRDSYIYRIDLRSLDANGFIVYANDRGFLDSDGTPLFHDVVAFPTLSEQEGNQLNQLIGDTQPAPPTHLIFFNKPSAEAIAANGISLEPVAPVLDSFQFVGPEGNGDTSVGAGGAFVFTSNVSGLFRLTISRDGLDFDPENPLNRVIRLTHDIGEVSVAWDGLDNAGNPFPPGNFSAKLIVRGGEIHFPILDPESSLEGGPTYTLINPPGGECPRFERAEPNCNIGFYDDRGYIAANGVPVGQPGQVLPGIVPPVPPNSDLINGFDTTTDQRSFGDGGINGFGDKKGIDLWTYFPSQTLLTNIQIISPNLAIAKDDGGVTAVPGDTVTYQLTYTNTTKIDVSGVVITDVVPLYTSFNAAASAPYAWRCPDGSPPGTICSLEIGPMAGLTTGSARIAFTIDENIPDDVTFIENAVIIREDGTHGNEPLDDNDDRDTTPLQRATPTPSTVTPTPTDKPAPFPTPTPKPTRRPPDDDDNPPPVAATPPPPTPSPTLAPTPTMPVLFLPETGERPISGLLWVFSVLGVGLGAWVIYLLRYRGNRDKRPD